MLLETDYKLNHTIIYLDETWLWYNTKKEILQIHVLLHYILKFGEAFQCCNGMSEDNSFSIQGPTQFNCIGLFWSFYIIIKPYYL